MWCHSQHFSDKIRPRPLIACLNCAAWAALALLDVFRALRESPEKLRLNKYVVHLRNNSPWSAIDNTFNLIVLNPYNFLLILSSAKIFMHIIWFIMHGLSLRFYLIKEICIFLLNLYLNFGEHVNVIIFWQCVSIYSVRTLQLL